MSSTRLPDKANAYIPPNKIAEYLLSETHAIGKPKAKFFRSLGFDETTVGQLGQGLLAIARAEQVRGSITSPHGTKYVIDGFLGTPKGVAVRVRTIWIREAEQDDPRFVTAYSIE